MAPPRKGPQSLISHTTLRITRGHTAVRQRQALGGRSPVSSLIMVLLPAPFLPTQATRLDSEQRIYPSSYI